MAATTIPKIIHQIWLGPAKRPTTCLYSWKKKHPDWQHIIWTTHDFPALREEFPEIPIEGFARHNSYVSMSDVLRLELLYHYGGWFIDADSYCLRPIDDLCDHSFVVVKHPPSPNNKELSTNAPANGIIGCTRKHPLIRRMMDHVSDYDPALPPFMSTGPEKLAPVIRVWDNPEFPVTVLPHETFLPFHWNSVEKLTDAANKLLSGQKANEEASVAPGSYAVQFWQSTQRDYILRGDLSRCQLLQKIR